MHPLKYLFALTALCVCAAYADAPPVLVPSAPGWTWGAVTPAENGTVEETHAYGIIAQAPASLAPGRYRLTVTARFDNPQSSKLVIFLPAGTHDFSQEIRSTSGYPADAANQWKTLRYRFDVEAGLKEAPALSFSDYNHLGGDHPNSPTAGRIQVQAASLKVEKQPLSVGVSYARPVKIRYRPGDAALLETSLTNATAQMQTVRVRPALVDENDVTLPGPTQTVTIPALSTVSMLLPFTAPRSQGGYQADAQIVAGGKVVDAQGDVFADTDNPFSFAIRVSWGLNWMLNPHEHSLTAAQAEQDAQGEQFLKANLGGLAWARSTYATYFEYMAWAHEDATILTEPTDAPYLSGQASWITSRRILRETIQQLKAQGMAPVAYVNAEPFGWSGFEVFRQNPEWFSYPKPGGPPSAGFNTQTVERYNQGTNPAGGDYPFIEPTWEAVSQATGLRYIDYHIKQLENSARLYGWEAYRYDAGPLPAKYFPLVKARLAKLNPPVAIGGNQSIVDLGPVQTPAWNVYCRGGSLMMDEAIDGCYDNPNSPQFQWAAWRDYLHTGAELTRRNGGYYQFIVQQGNWLATTLGYASGGHPYSYEVLQNPFGTNERFMLRYGSLFWDLNSQLMPQAQAIKALAVTSVRPLWWETSVNERILGTKRRQVIVPLINTPTGSTVNDTTMPVQASGVRVSFTPKAGEAVQAFLYASEPTVRRQALTMTRLSGGGVSVTVPPFWAWANVVFDCRKGMERATPVTLPARPPTM